MQNFWNHGSHMFPQAAMKPRINNSVVRLGVGRVPKTQALTVRFESSALFASLGNKAEREALRRFARDLLHLCDLQEGPRVCIDPSVCRDCGYRDAECRCE